MESYSPLTLDLARGIEYRNWTVGSLQERARELGPNYRGLSKDELVTAVEGARPQSINNMDGLPSEGNRASSSDPSPWIACYEEEMAILGPEATLEDRREAIRRAHERETLRGRDSLPSPSTPRTDPPRVTRKDFKPFC